MADQMEWILRSENALVRVHALAGALRAFSVGEVDVLEPFLGTLPPPLACGIMLAPWPNRVAGAMWRLHGEPQQLDITEPARGHAIHGLLRNTEYRVHEQDDHSLVLRARIWPQSGYPFQLLHTVTYRLEEQPRGSGLWVHQSLRNESPVPAPGALGAHPYVRIGAVPPEELTLTVPAGQYLEVDERLIPYGVKRVQGQSDLRAGRRLSELEMDRAYTGLVTDTDGWARSVLRADDGRSVCLLHRSSYVHVFVTTAFPGRERVVALEPITAPANAFNSGDALLWLKPDEHLSLEWGIVAEC